MPDHLEWLPRVEFPGPVPGRCVNHHLFRWQPGRERVYERLDAAAARREIVRDNQYLRHRWSLYSDLRPADPCSENEGEPLRPDRCVELGPVPAGDRDFLHGLPRQPVQKVAIAGWYRTELDA